MNLSLRTSERRAESTALAGVASEAHEIVCDPRGHAFVLDRGNRRVLRVDMTLDPPGVSSYFDARDRGTDKPSIDICDIAVDAEGGVLLADARGARILRLLPDGNLTELPTAVRAP